MNDIDNKEVVLLRTILAVAIILGIDPELLARTTTNEKNIDDYIGKLNGKLLDVITEKAMQLKDDIKN